MLKISIHLSNQGKLYYTNCLSYEIKNGCLTILDENGYKYINLDYIIYYEVDDGSKYAKIA